jgi:hypothetical protein
VRGEELENLRRGLEAHGRNTGEAETLGELFSWV